jgi:hypothetical protein
MKIIGNLGNYIYFTRYILNNNESEKEFREGEIMMKHYLGLNALFNLGSALLDGLGEVRG